MRPAPESPELQDSYEALLAHTMDVQRRYGRVQDVLDLLTEEGDELTGDDLYDAHAPERIESADLMRRRVEVLRMSSSVTVGGAADAARRVQVADALGYSVRIDDEGDVELAKGDLRILLKKPWGDGFGFVPGSTRFGAVDASVQTRRGERRAAYWHDGWIRCCRDPRIQRAIDEAVAFFG